MVALVLCTLLSTTPSAAVPLYDTFEFTITSAGVEANQFTTFALVDFSIDDRHLTVDGFYDGEDTWRVRFMPDAMGKWRYRWELEGETGEGSFTCTAKESPQARGHVRRDPARPRSLLHDDDTAHYEFGVPRFNAAAFGPPRVIGQINLHDIDDTHLLTHVDPGDRHPHLDLQVTPFTGLFNGHGKPANEIELAPNAGNADDTTTGCSVKIKDGPPWN